jgi:hypothetical protein
MALTKMSAMMLCTIKMCGVLGYYAASCGNCLPTFRDSVSHHTFCYPTVLSRIYVIGLHCYSDSWPMRMGLIRCPKTSVNSYHTTLCNIPEDRRFHQHRGGSLK